MSDIKIREPFNIEIQILEFDNKLYSVKLLLNYFVLFFQERLIEISNQIWIECKVWDDFILQVYKMKMGESKTAKLHSMSDEILIELFNKNEKFLFVLYCNKLVDSSIKIENLISSSINTEQLSYLYEQLNSFEKWW
jgi:hypothetical protein